MQSGAGNEQVRALGIRVAIRADGSVACGARDAAWVAFAEPDFVDRRRNGGGALRGHDHEPHRRHPLRSGKSANETTRATYRRPKLAICMAFHTCCRGLIFVRALPAES